MRKKINCIHNEKGAWCKNKNVKRSIFGFGARVCCEFNWKKCELRTMKEKDNRTPMQKKFEKENPGMRKKNTIEYLTTYCAWLEFQLEKSKGSKLEEREKQRKKAKQLFDETSLDKDNPMYWHIWKKAFDLGVSESKK